MQVAIVGRYRTHLIGVETDDIVFILSFGAKIGVKLKSKRYGRNVSMKHCARLGALEYLRYATACSLDWSRVWSRGQRQPHRGDCPVGILTILTYTAFASPPTTTYPGTRVPYLDQPSLLHPGNNYQKNVNLRRLQLEAEGL